MRCREIFSIILLGTSVVGTSVNETSVEAINKRRFGIGNIIKPIGNILKPLLKPRPPRPPRPPIKPNKPRPTRPVRQTTRPTRPTRPTTRPTTRSTKPQGFWGSWGSWGFCSETCGAGVKIRRRRCIGSRRSCSGPSYASTYCNLGTCKPESACVPPAFGGDTKQFSTPNSYTYKLIDGISILGGVKFSVEATNDIHISLSENNQDRLDRNSWEIVLGGWHGTKSVIRSSHQGSNLVTVNHSKEQFLKWQCDFEMKSTGNIIGLYDSEGNAIIEYDHFDAKNFRYMYISTGWGATGTWRINAKLELKPCCSEILLTGAFNLPTENYHIQEGLVHHRQYYLNAGKTKALWFDGFSGNDPDWIFGSFEELQAEKYHLGWMQSNSNDHCPSDVVEWQEHFQSKWQDNPEVNVQCVG